MNHTQMLLETTYRNSQMGVETLEKLTEMELDAELVNVLTQQYHDYKSINDAAHRLLISNGYKVKDLNPAAIISADLTIKFKTLADKSPAHIAEMVMKGNANGIIAATKNLNQCDDNAEPFAVALAQKLLEIEQSNFEQLKPFLS